MKRLLGGAGANRGSINSALTTITTSTMTRRCISIHIYMYTYACLKYSQNAEVNLMEAKDTTAALGMWDQHMGSYPGPYSTL